MRRNFLPVTLIAAGLACTPALAQQDQQSGSRSDSNQMQQQGNKSERSGKSQRTASSQQAKPQGPSVVVGEVVGMRKVSLKGNRNVEHQLVKVRTEGKKSVVIDVGSTSDGAQAPNLQKGDHIIAVGKQARINGEPVLFARHIGELFAAGNPGTQVSGQRQASSDSDGSARR